MSDAPTNAQKLTRIEVVDGATVIPLSIEAMLVGILAVIPANLTGQLVVAALKAQTQLDDPERRIQIAVNRIVKPTIEAQ